MFKIGDTVIPAYPHLHGVGIGTVRERCVDNDALFYVDWDIKGSILVWNIKTEWHVENLKLFHTKNNFVDKDRL